MINIKISFISISICTNRYITQRFSRLEILKENEFGYICFVNWIKISINDRRNDFCNFLYKNVKYINLILNLVDFYWTMLLKLVKRNSLDKRIFEILLYFEIMKTFIYIIKNFFLFTRTINFQFYFFEYFLINILQRYIIFF